MVALRQERFAASRVCAMAAKRVVLNSQPARIVWSEILPAFCARMMNTACVISSARCGSRTCRNAAE
jgi:hypothetical protein